MWMMEPRRTLQALERNTSPASSVLTFNLPRKSFLREDEKTKNRTMRQKKRKKRKRRYKIRDR